MRNDRGLLWLAALAGVFAVAWRIRRGRGEAVPHGPLQRTRNGTQSGGQTGTRSGGQGGQGTVPRPAVPAPAEPRDPAPGTTTSGTTGPARAGAPAPPGGFRAVARDVALAIAWAGVVASVAVLVLLWEPWGIAEALPAQALTVLLGVAVSAGALLVVWVAATLRGRGVEEYFRRAPRDPAAPPRGGRAWGFLLGIPPVFGFAIITELRDLQTTGGSPDLFPVFPFPVPPPLDVSLSALLLTLTLTCCPLAIYVYVRSHLPGVIVVGFGVAIGALAFVNGASQGEAGGGLSLIESFGLSVESYLIAALLFVGAFLWAYDHRSDASRSNLGAALIGGSLIGFIIFTQQDIAAREQARQAGIDAIKTQSDLTGADLGGRDLAGLALRSRRLDDANLDAASLRATDLSRSNLTRATLVGAKAAGARLTGAVLTCADLRNADLRDADLTGVRLGLAIRGGALRPQDAADAASCRSENGDLWGTVRLGGADLRGANLAGADLRRADFCGADLRGVDLSRTRLLAFAADAYDDRFYALFRNAAHDHTTIWPARVDPARIPSRTGPCGP